MKTPATLGEIVPIAALHSKIVVSHGREDEELEGRGGKIVRTGDDKSRSCGPAWRCYTCKSEPVTEGRDLAAMGLARSTGARVSPNTEAGKLPRLRCFWEAARRDVAH